MKLTKCLSVGVEPEGSILISAIKNGEFHHDGSVEVDGSGNGCNGDCRDDCECGNDCECDSCVRCEQCDSHVDDCECGDCYSCMLCDAHYEDCECEKAHQQNTGENGKCLKCLEVIKKEEGDACDECYEAFTNDNWSHSCWRQSMQYVQCDMDCGCECQCECTCENGEGQDGEAVSHPMPETEMEEWLDSNEDAILRTNQTCGMHVHVGNMTMQEYGVLMDEKFHNFLKTELLLWGKKVGIREGSSFWRRLEGRNTFCKDEFRPEEQKHDRSKSGQRYCFINYCWRLHGTMEVRILPCFQRPDLRVKGFKEVMRIIHTYLADNKPKIHSLEIKEVI